MKRIFAIAIIVVLTLSLLPAAVFADKGGNGAPTGKHFNVNLIGAPNEKNDNFDGGNGARIFVKRTGSTFFYVESGSSFAINDHDGTDGRVGSMDEAGLVFPYEGEAPTGSWDVEIWVRLGGPNDANNTVDWSSYTPGINGHSDVAVEVDGGTWYLWDSFTLNKSNKFSEKTSQLLCDEYENMLWDFDAGAKFRICQMRIYVN